MTTFALSGSVPACDAHVVFVRPAARGKAPEIIGAHKCKQQAKLVESLKAVGATGAAGQVHTLPGSPFTAAATVVAVGVGANANADALRAAAGVAARALAGKKRAAVAPTTTDEAGIRAISEGLLLGAYTFNEYRTNASSPVAGVKAITLLVDNADSVIKAAVHRAETTAAAVNAARDFANTPASDLYPATFVQRVKEQIAELPITMTVLDEKALAKDGFGGILGVGQGSQRPPRLLRLEYAPAGATRHVSYVGKGITFDTGGISLKPPVGMSEMKADMSGAAAVVQATMAIARLGLPVRVTAYAALAENMPGSLAQRPGDVLTTYSGRTVEVLNTDAEGRLVLCDALTRAQEDKPDVVINVATLTGAAAIALGPWMSAIMGNDQGLVDDVLAAAEAGGEPFWQLPLPAMYRPNLSSLVADLANIYETPPPGKGGTLYGGLFLQEFINKGQKWAHLDIASPAFNSGAPYGYTPRGAAGTAVRTLVEYAVSCC